VSILGLTLADGDPSDVQGGGAILSREDVTIISSTITGNHDMASAGGGIAHYSGNLTVLSTTVSYNSTQGHGGGIYSLTVGNVTISDSSIRHNSTGSELNDDGGGVHVRGAAAVTIADTTIAGNTAIGNGAGIFLQDNIVSTLNHVVASDNQALQSGGGVYISGGTANISNSTVSDNFALGNGGGILDSTNMSIGHSTISGNVAGARGGGIFHNRGETRIINSTISTNRAEAGGGGIFSRTQSGDVLTISHSTITRNVANLSSGGGIYLESSETSGSAGISYSIVADNAASLLSAPDIDNTSAPLHPALNTTSSLVGNNRGSGVPADFLIGTDENPVDPELGPLADNGGPTLTHALLPGSPAIDNGGIFLQLFGRTYDQRGAPFMRSSIDRFDIGAYEAQQSSAVFGGDYNQNGTVDAADYVVWRKTFGTSVIDYTIADGDGDGVVDSDDHGVWRRNFARELPAAATTSGGAAAAANESHETSAFSTAGQVRHGGSSTSSGTPMQPLAPAGPVPSAIRDSVESSLNPSLRGRVTERALELRVAERRDGALAAWLSMRGRGDGAANEDVIEALPYMRDEASRESPFQDALDEAFALSGFGRVLSPFQGFGELVGH
jgi:predicted outer membrane repeat protein